MSLLDIEMVFRRAFAMSVITPYQRNLLLSADRSRDIRVLLLDALLVDEQHR